MDKNDASLVLKRRQKSFFDKKYVKRKKKQNQALPGVFSATHLMISDIEIVKMVNKLELNDSSVVLDAGCGDQPLCYVYATRKNCNVIGVDFSRHGLKLAKSNAIKFGFKGSFEAVVADIGYLPFRSRSFNAVVQLMVLEHLDEPQLVMTETSRVLKVNGKVFVYTVNKIFPLRRFYNFFYPRHLKSLLHSKEHFYTHNDIEDLFRRNDLKLEEQAFVFNFLSAIWDLIILPRLININEKSLKRSHPFLRSIIEAILPLLRKIAILDFALKRRECSSAIIAIGTCNKRIK